MVKISNSIDYRPPDIFDEKSRAYYISELDRVTRYLGSDFSEIKKNLKIKGAYEGMNEGSESNNIRFVRDHFEVLEINDKTMKDCLEYYSNFFIFHHKKLRSLVDSEEITGESLAAALIWVANCQASTIFLRNYHRMKASLSKQADRSAVNKSNAQAIRAHRENIRGVIARALRSNNSTYLSLKEMTEAIQSDVERLIQEKSVKVGGFSILNLQDYLTMNVDLKNEWCLFSNEVRKHLKI